MVPSMRKRDKAHSFHYNAMRCDDAHISYHHILYSTYCLCTKDAQCENEFDGQGLEVFALFSFEIFITFFRTIHTMDRRFNKKTWNSCGWVDTSSEPKKKNTPCICIIIFQYLYIVSTAQQTHSVEPLVPWKKYF